MNRNGRIYPENPHYDLNKKYCPICKLNQLSTKIVELHLFYSYYCQKCKKEIDKSKVLCVDDIRNLKINKILNK